MSQIVLLPAVSVVPDITLVNALEFLMPRLGQREMTIERPGAAALADARRRARRLGNKHKAEIPRVMKVWK